jgi:hypothetical protein
MCRKTTVSNCHRCLINNCVKKNEKHFNIDKKFDNQMSLGKGNCYFNNCLYFSKCAVPLQTCNFYCIVFFRNATWCQCYKTFFLLSPTLNLNKLERLSLVSYYSLPFRCSTLGSLQSLPTNIRLRWKRLSGQAL